MTVMPMVLKLGQEDMYISRIINASPTWTWASYHDVDGIDQIIDTRFMVMPIMPDMETTEEDNNETPADVDRPMPRARLMLG